MESKLAKRQLPIVKFFVLAKKSGQKPGFKKAKWAERVLKTCQMESKLAKRQAKTAKNGLFWGILGVFRENLNCGENLWPKTHFFFTF